MPKNNDTNDSYKTPLFEVTSKGFYGTKNHNWEALLVGHRAMI